MAVGANLLYGNSRQQLQHLLMSAFAAKRHDHERNRKICIKQGAPANNTVADNPNAKYDICIDGTQIVGGIPTAVYICTVFSTDASATTWTRIV